ncbi:ATP-binding protein [Streptomyces fulvoviolaceus]|uniref:ATP-binding protein n=1 Tax=Streptomyces fulvoviolaceus TaxID=285535 RepID=UPI0028F6CA62|nr:ATP-binding protein [Streptomyces fulvoviolaceus]
MVTVPPSKPAESPSWSYALHLPYDPRAARIARRTLRTVLDEHGMAELADSAELLTSELVTNAYQHSNGPAALRMSPLDGQRLRLSVWDTNPHIPPPFDRGSCRPVAVPAVAESGRGLFLVCHYAQAWGSWPLGDDLFGQGGKLLWCELGIPVTSVPNETAPTRDTQMRAAPNSLSFTPAPAPAPECS